ncbi:polymeric immunoglobulin receptor-like protein [Labeo rohita]|nr:polymeric immunoglobulin receptor-like protein [Labeo rohita]
MKILLIFFTFYLISGAVKDIDVTGYSGGSVLVDSWNPWHKNDPKYMRKLQSAIIINNTKHDQWINEGSFTLFCNKYRNLMIYIKEMNQQDAGTYKIGVEDKWFIDMTLNVEKVAQVVRHEGESAEIICPYDSIYKSKSKSLCKGKCSTRDRNTLNETVREEKETKTDRLTLNDDVTASVFTGTITGQIAEDAGKYWCAVTLERDLNYLYTHLIVIMNEELNLTKYEGDDVSIQCKHQDEDQKSFCKAHEASMCVKDGVSLETIRDDRFSFSDEASTGVFTVNITDLREEDSGIYWCGAHVTTKVNLTVKKVADSSSKRSHTTAENSEAVSRISVIAKRRPSDTVQEQVFITSGDDLNYAVVNFHKKMDCPDSVTLRSNQDYSEYAAVNHHTA